MAAEVRVTVTSLLLAFGWVLLGLLSLSTGLIALLTAMSMARQADDGGSTGWAWALAIFLVFGLPFALAGWKHHREPRKIRSTMAWLPTVWNAMGLLIATQLVPDLMGSALRNVDWVAQGHFGDSHSSTRALSALGHESAELIDPEGGEFPAPRISGSKISLDNAISVPMAHEGAAIFLSVSLGGPKGKVDRRYLFDTGASYTTITSETAQELGIEVPDDAPTLEFNTATGLRESRVVYLDSLTLDDIEIPGLLVSVCDSCATEHTSGLLGLNVMREFFVQMDYQDRRMQLIPRLHEGRANRAYDIEPVVTMEIEDRPEIWLGRVRWIILLHNTGSQPIENVLPRVDFRNGHVLYGEVVPRIEPGETGRSLLVGQAADGQGGGSVEFTLTLAEAHW
jgi:hypothetical protein